MNSFIKNKFFIIYFFLSIIYKFLLSCLGLLLLVLAIVALKWFFIFIIMIFFSKFLGWRIFSSFFFIWWREAVRIIIFLFLIFIIFIFYAFLYRFPNLLFLLFCRCIMDLRVILDSLIHFNILINFTYNFLVLLFFLLFIMIRVMIQIILLFIILVFDRKIKITYHIHINVKNRFFIEHEVAGVIFFRNVELLIADISIGEENRVCEIAKELKVSINSAFNAYFKHSSENTQAINEEGTYCQLMYYIHTI